MNPARARRGDKHGRETDEEFLIIEDTDSNEAGWILINPTDYPRGPDYPSRPRGEQLYGLQFGAYGWTKVLVWSRSLEKALEEAAGWLADHAPGIFVDQDELARLEKEYREEHPDADDDDVSQGAYEDLTYTESGYIPSWEWGIGFDSENQGTDNDFYKVAWEASKEEYEAEYGEDD